MNIPSAPTPETPQHRAELTQSIRAATGLDEAVLERLVRVFYGAAREDKLLGPVFAHVTDWEAHIRQICAFWSSVALMTGRYHGQPLAAHLPLPLGPEHFARWLVLFGDTARSVCSPEGAEYLIGKAHRIARSLEIGIEVSRGVLPKGRGEGAAAGGGPGRLQRR